MTYKCTIEGCASTIELTESVSSQFKYTCKNHPRELQVSSVRVYDPVSDNRDAEEHFQDHQFEELRHFSSLKLNKMDATKVFNSSNTDNMNGLKVKGYQIISPNQHEGDVPEWTKEDDSIQRILLLAFPKLHIEEKQRYRASLWNRFIYLYFRLRYTEGQIAEEMNLSLTEVRLLRQRIYFVSNGLTANGRPRKK